MAISTIEIASHHANGVTRDDKQQKLPQMSGFKKDPILLPGTQKNSL